MLADPKPFVGFSDNTNILNWLWNIGVAGYHGGSTMMHLGRGGSVHPVSVGSLRAALITGGDLTLEPVDTFGEDEMDWADGASAVEPLMQPGLGWQWQNADRVVTGRTWGGNLEIVHWNLAANRWIQPVDHYGGCVLLLETSEELPTATAVYCMLRNAGERGLLRQFPAVVVGLAKASSFGQRTATERTTYRSEQQQAILRAFVEYNPTAMVVFGVEIGHTDPQWVVPYGGMLTVDGPARRIVAHFGPPIKGVT